MSIYIDKYGEEEWRDIPGYEDVYQASSFGRIKRLSYTYYMPLNGKECFQKERILKPSIGNGYLRVNLSRGGVVKGALVHRLIALTFVKNISGKPEINHINGIKTDNKPSNLEWCTSSENKIHCLKNGLRIAPNGSKHWNVKLSDSEVKIIRSIGRSVKAKQIADTFKISVSLVYSILNRRERKLI